MCVCGCARVCVAVCGPLTGAQATPAKWAMLATFAALALATYALLFVRGYYVSLVLLPVLYWLGPACMLHDGTHFSLSHSPRVNAAFAWFGMLHMNPCTCMSTERESPFCVRVFCAMLTRL